jgi:hypothetical protein
MWINPGVKVTGLFFPTIHAVLHQLPVLLEGESVFFVQESLLMDEIMSEIAPCIVSMMHTSLTERN